MPFQTTETEAKYAFRPGRGELIRQGLASLCHRDREHPIGTITSVYFDTPSRTHLAEKRNSDFVKDKIRLRWYTDSEGVDSGPFLERKSKLGTRRIKVRRELPGEEIGDPGASRFFRELDVWAESCAELGYQSRGAIFPMISIRYRRERFFDPRLSARISVDRGIEILGVNPDYFPSLGRIRLSIGVLEIKSRTGELNPALGPIRNHLSRRDALSKYEEAWVQSQDPMHRREFQWMNFEN